jgi:membrane protease YdiL (CAAX protease family)
MHDDVDELDIDQSKFLTIFACYILLDMLSGNVINNVLTASCKIFLKYNILPIYLHVFSIFLSKILVLLFVLLCSRKIGIFREMLGQKRSLFAFAKSTFSNFVMAISLAYLSYFIWNVALNFLKKFEFNIDLEEQVPLKLLNDITNKFFLTLFLFQIIVIAPIVEELVFRGYVYIVLKSKSNKNVARIVTSIIFSLLHFNVAVSVPLFVFSMCLTKAYEDSSDIREPIVMHSLFNTVGVIGALIKV